MSYDIAKISIKSEPRTVFTLFLPEKESFSLSGHLFIVSLPSLFKDL